MICAGHVATVKNSRHRNRKLKNVKAVASILEVQRSSMSNKTIWNALRAGGMTAAGTAAMMGNMSCESAMRSTNVQDGMGYSDEKYTADIDNGRIGREAFATDDRGYGLCQWTHPYRKRNLYEFSARKRTSIGDEAMQLEFCINEMKSEYSDVWSLCCSADINTMKLCSDKICEKYENPAIKNYNDRYEAAEQFYNQFAQETSTPIPPAGEITYLCVITVRELKQGDKGRDVYLAQCGLNDCGYSCGEADGDYGPKTASAVRDFRQACNLAADGHIDQDVWQILFQ